jgi:hypothetical protein
MFGFYILIGAKFPITFGEIFWDFKFLSGKKASTDKRYILVNTTVQTFKKIFERNKRFLNFCERNFVEIHLNIDNVTNAPPLPIAILKSAKNIIYENF